MTMPDSLSLSKRDQWFWGALIALELSLAVIATTLYMRGERPFLEFFQHRPGIVLLVALTVFVLSTWSVVHRCVAQHRAPSGHFRFVIMMNLATMMVLLISTELMVRVSARREAGKQFVGNVELIPRDWGRTRAYYRALWKKSKSSDAPLMVYDDQMGWGIGRNGFSTPMGEQPYWSSAEGLRAPQGGVTLIRPNARTKIALIGDSFTFGEEVSFEETWGYQVGQWLGPETQVLNFGVPGYGLHQAYLRYEKEVRSWKPRVVIFGFISHNLLRTMRVYPFLSTKWDIPFSEPRFDVRDGELINLNPHPLPPEAIFAKKSIQKLPLLTYDPGYVPHEWQRRWYHHSYLVRFIMSVFPAWSPERLETSEEKLLLINGEILKAFIQEVREDGAIPFVVYFPMRADFGSSSSSPSLGKRMLEEAGIPYIDTTPCLMEVDPNDRFLVGHYSPTGNAAVAKCVYDAIKEPLASIMEQSVP